jgi:hypothetical protein
MKRRVFLGTLAVGGLAVVRSLEPQDKPGVWRPQSGAEQVLNL